MEPAVSAGRARQVSANIHPFRVGVIVPARQGLGPSRGLILKRKQQQQN